MPSLSMATTSGEPPASVCVCERGGHVLSRGEWERLLVRRLCERGGTEGLTRAGGRQGGVGESCGRLHRRPQERQGRQLVKGCGANCLPARLPACPLACRYQPYHDGMVSTAWGAPNACVQGFDPSLVGTKCVYAGWHLARGALGCGASFPRPAGGAYVAAAAAVSPPCSAS